MNTLRTALIWLFRGGGVVMMVNGLWMLANALHWFTTLPAGLPDTGPPNGHLIRDVGLAYLIFGAAVVWVTFDLRTRHTVFVCAAVFAGGTMLAAPARACSVVTATPIGGGPSPSPTPRDEQAIFANSVRGVDVIFVGQVFSEIEGVWPRQIVVQAKQYLKGQGPTHVVVGDFGIGPDCRMPAPEIGMELIFLAYYTREPANFFVEDTYLTEDKVSVKYATPENLAFIQEITGQTPTLPTTAIADYLPPPTQPQPTLPLWALAGGLASGLVALAIWHQARSKK